ncbi:ATP-grasp domain-containing protein [Clostridium sp. B9]|uniref:ATP-grasp domain-containing protein n=1 Tax=Clostridium sp. B9 TaxID=3423224 RepID=UPI003D2ED7DE
MKANILFSSVGRRVELVKAFREAKESLAISGNLIGVDMDDLAPAMRFVDKGYRVPRINSKDFIREIIEVCKREEVDLIIPTLDTELKTYSENKELIEKESGAKVLVGNKEIISIIRNKEKTCEYLEKNGFLVPKVIKEEDILNKKVNFPLFIKPLDGSSSISNFKVENYRELIFFKEYVKNPIIQEFIEGEEYCIDVFNDFSGNVITVVPKLRIGHRAGEITKAKVVKDKDLIDLGIKLGRKLKIIGEFNFDCIKNSDGIKILEINGRFAGGAPISFKAGANSAKNIYKLLIGEKLEYNEDFKDKFIALRFDDAIFIED